MVAVCLFVLQQMGSTVTEVFVKLIQSSFSFCFQLSVRVGLRCVTTTSATTTAASIL